MLKITFPERFQNPHENISREKLEKLKDGNATEFVTEFNMYYIVLPTKDLITCQNDINLMLQYYNVVILQKTKLRVSVYFYG